MNNAPNPWTNRLSRAILVANIWFVTSIVSYFAVAAVGSPEIYGAHGFQTIGLEIFLFPFRILAATIGIVTFSLPAIRPVNITLLLSASFLCWSLIMIWRRRGSVYIALTAVNSVFFAIVAFLRWVPS